MALLELRGVSKSFPGVQALRQVDLAVEAGEVHALIGENGAGKSTLIKLLSGVYERDAGSIRFQDTPVNFGSPHESQQAGIRTLYQEFNLLPQLTVAENIFLGAEPHLRWLPLINWSQMQHQTTELLDMLGLDLQPRTRVSKLSVAEQQMVELAKMLHTHASLLIMDEPTATLSQPEVATLFKLINRIKARGVGIIYISHRLDEVLAIADRATILRDGRRVVTVDVADSSVDLLSHLMSGLTTTSPRTFRNQRKPGAEVLRIEKLTRDPAFREVSFSLRAGEIVGLTGLIGSGRSALVRALFGFDPIDSGRMLVDGRPVRIQSPQDAVALGMGMLPEERQRDGLLLDLSVRENMSLVALEQYGMMVDTAAEAHLVNEYIERLHIKIPNVEAKAATLSGGTQQKLILSRWLAAHPHILIFDEPTRGIDIAARSEIYRLMSGLAARGTAILLVSSDLAEIVSLCNR
ncbi:MAG TPA: sugar ABC transporter ATP-binding protein, partial [Phototrophicaceae bacterium]|nr:sugar ABC transporter ATP-binding protein [Phototrophicaceae bacterium]